jgi:hypothetical protein
MQSSQNQAIEIYFDWHAADPTTKDRVMGRMSEYLIAAGRGIAGTDPDALKAVARAITAGSGVVVLCSDEQPMVVNAYKAADMYRQRCLDGGIPIEVMAARLWALVEVYTKGPSAVDREPDRDRILAATEAIRNELARLRSFAGLPPDEDRDKKLAEYIGLVVDRLRAISASDHDQTVSRETEAAQR